MKSVCYGLEVKHLLWAHVWTLGAVGGAVWGDCETFGRWTWLEQVDLRWVGTEAYGHA